MGLLTKGGFKERVRGGGGGRTLGSKTEVQKSVARSGVCKAGAGAIVLLHFLLNNLDESGAS
jgi:hypothetical protein